MCNIYKINAGELTEKDLDIIVISLCHFKAVCLKNISMKDQLRETDEVMDKILGKL
jgi:hypothetical protein